MRLQFLATGCKRWCVSHQTIWSSGAQQECTLTCLLADRSWHLPDAWGITGRIWRIILTPSDQRHSFAPGREPQGVWEWLAVRQRLPELLDALRYIDRTDIVVEVLAPPATPASPPGVTWQGSPFPGCAFYSRRRGDLLWP